MSIMNLGKYVSLLQRMQDAIDVSAGVKNVWNDSGDGGWQTSKPKNIEREQTLVLTAPETVTEGDGVMKTVNIASEIVHGNLNATALVGTTGMWFDGREHRTLSPNLEYIRNILISAIAAVSFKSHEDAESDKNKFLLCVSDLHENKCMSRGSSDGYTHLSSQMTIIDSFNFTHSITLDRLQITKHSTTQTHYVWRALMVKSDHELSIKQFDADRNAMYTPANCYIAMGDYKLAVFSRPFESVPTPPTQEIEYAYRKMT